MASKFFQACFKGNLNVISKSIKLGHNINLVNDLGETGLIIASMNNKVDVVKMLLGLNADFDHKDKEGNTALIYASARGFSKIFDALINAGANTKVKNNSGKTPLIYAIMQNKVPEANKLIDLNSSLDEADDRGLTPLMWACSSKVGENILDLLLEKKVSVNSQCVDGNTPLHYILNNCISDAKKLIAYGANPFLSNNKGENIQDILKKKTFNVRHLFGGNNDDEKILEEILSLHKIFLKKKMDILREDLCKKVFSPRFFEKLWTLDESGELVY
jgi:ankyrin repeat protein